MGLGCARLRIRLAVEDLRILEWLDGSDESWTPRSRVLDFVGEIAGMLFLGITRWDISNI